MYLRGLTVICLGTSATLTTNIPCYCFLYTQSPHFPPTITITNSAEQLVRCVFNS